MNSLKELTCNIRLFWGAYIILSCCPDSHLELDGEVLTFYGPTDESDKARKILQAIDTLEDFGRSFELIIKEEAS